MVYVIVVVALAVSVFGIGVMLQRRGPSEGSSRPEESTHASGTGGTGLPDEEAPSDKRVLLRFGTTVSRLDEAGEVREQDISDPSVLACFHGMKLLYHDDEPGSDPVFDTYPEIIVAALRLVFADGELHAELALTLDDVPKATHLERYRAELPTDYWERSWAHDLDWDEPEEMPPRFDATDRLALTVSSELSDLRVS